MHFVFRTPAQRLRPRPDYWPDWVPDEIDLTPRQIRRVLWAYFKYRIRKAFRHGIAHLKATGQKRLKAKD